MSVHDLRCPVCGQVYEVVIPASVGASRSGACCPACTTIAPHHFVYLTPLPAIRLSLFSDGGPTGGRDDFQKFTLPVEDPGAPSGFRDVTISSLQDIRRLERESEQRERDGLGRRMVWRDYSQDRSNRDAHTLAPDPSLRPAKHYLNGQPVEIRRGDPVVADHGVPPEFQEVG